MKVIEKFDIPGMTLLQGHVHKDHRGNFEEHYRAAAFKNLGLPPWFVQENISSSRKGVIRGLHFQREKPQGKFVRCLRGSIYDVCLDLRRDSPTFRQWRGVILDASQGRSLYLPEGTAHGFCALEDSTVLYKCTRAWDVALDAGVHYADPDLNIPWHVWLDGVEPILSEKDMNLPRLEDVVR